MKADEHHPSCRPSDKDLVWLCSQCGAVEPAENLEEQLAAEREKVKQMRLEFERIVQFRHTYDEVISIARAALAKVKE